VPGRRGVGPGVIERRDVVSDRASAPADVARRLEGLLRETPMPGLVSVYLFGSHAAGRAHRESDVDVAVLLDRRVHETREARFRERVRLSAWAVGALHRNAVDVVVLNDAPPQLARHIVSTGQRVFCRDGEVDHAFVRDVQLRAADLEPFLRRTRRIKLDAFRR
jgi:predicted nucleotidyltransferase